MFGRDEKEKKVTVGKGDQAKTDFDLRLLKRVDLLELLYEQASENEQNAATVAELTEQLDRLKQRLDEKDAQIEHLKQKLDEKDVQIEHLKQRLGEKDAQIEHLKQKLDEKDAQIAELKESSALYARAAEMVSHDDLVKIQESALRQYLTTLAGAK